MRRFGRIVGWLLLALAVAALGYDLAALASSGAFQFTALGQIWFNLDAGSLNLTQAVVERYLWPPIWHQGIAPVLLWPAFFVFLLPALLLLVLCRRKRGFRRR